MFLLLAVLALQGRLLAYAGVGVVAASEVTAEWQELCLKVRWADTRKGGGILNLPCDYTLLRRLIVFKGHSRMAEALPQSARG